MRPFQQSTRPPAVARSGSNARSGTVFHVRPLTEGHDSITSSTDLAAVDSAVPLYFQEPESVSAPYHPQKQKQTILDGAFDPWTIPLYGAEQFPLLEGSDLSFMYGSSLVPAPSIVSSHSSSSTVSRRSSAKSTLSSILTDLPPQQLQQQRQSDFLLGNTSWSHGPSPLRSGSSTLPSPTYPSTSTAAEGQTDLMPFTEQATLSKSTEQGPGSGTHSHFCLWGLNGPCSSGPFATQEELNWHVKAQHLLVCPILGCTEASFADSYLVDVHIRWSHKRGASGKDQELCQSSDLLSLKPILASPAAETKKKAASLNRPRDDLGLKMELTIATSKKKCREQLKAALEKKARGHPVATPGPIESPSVMRSRTPRLTDSVGFPLIWENGVLPFLAELMPKWCGPGHVISVIRGRKRDTRRICLMTTKPLSKARKVMIAGHVQDLLPDSYRGRITFVFSTGEVERLTWARGLSKDMPDDICVPRNPFCYISPQMGDSIGMVLPNGDDTSATLGPCLKIGEAGFWLVNFHPFEEVNLSGAAAHVEHPSPEDRDRCLQENHDALDGPGIDFRIGSLTATSGYDLKTTRISHEPFWEDCDKEPPLVVTDWALISSKVNQANMIRKFPSTATPQREIPITRMSSVVPGVEVCSTGRTSGFQRGLVCEVPAYLDGRKNGTGKATREWFIEEPFENDDEDSWIRGGMGVPGDSGAAVIDCETNALIGQLWGRNKYFGAGPRFAFFTPIFDIIDDIQERCGEQTRPRLPQYREEAERWPAYPLCRPCFDLQEYRSSRRSSRESLLSMIPGIGLSGDKDHDLRTISELATPKEAADQAYWVRHAGPEDAGSSSFGAGFSPTPVMSTFFFNPFAASPRASGNDMKSPYAMDIHDDDLNEGVDVTAYSGLGKRSLGTTSLVRSASHQSAKWRRIM